MGSNANEEKRRKGGKPRKTSLTTSGSGARIGWDVVLAAELKEIICTVTDNGGAIMFGKGRHGDVLSIRVYHDTLETKTQWAANEDEVGDEFYTIDDYFRKLANDSQ